MRSIQRSLVPVILSLVGLCSSAKAQSVYSAIQDAASFGYLSQYSLNGVAYNFVGPQACVPTSSVNVMTYLQNVAPGYFGTNLTGTSYDDWIGVDATLTGPGYMNTSPINGTQFNYLHFGLNKYITQDRGFTEVQFSGAVPSAVWNWNAAPEPRPDTFSDSPPTWDFLYNSLTSGSGTVLGLSYVGETFGHAISLGGFEWSDLNGNGRVDSSEATLYFVDPLDPTKGMDPIGGARFTTGNLWSEMVPDPKDPSVIHDVLTLQYNQYHPEQKTYSPATAYIVAATAISVPEPSSVALLGLATLGAFVLSRRGKID